MSEASFLVSGLLQTFSTCDDTTADWQAINAQLRRIGMRVTIDGQNQQIGLSIGDGPIDWQPLGDGTRHLALQEGIANPQILDSTPGREWLLAEGHMPQLADEPGPEIPKAAQAFLGCTEDGHRQHHAPATARASASSSAVRSTVARVET